MQNILVVGGAGYIGSMLSRRLVEDGHNVTVLDSFRYGQKSLLDLCYYDNFNVKAGDCRQKEVLQPLVAKADVIIMLAAIVGAEACDLDPFDAQSTNLGAVKDLISFVSKDQKILYPCTNSGYGIGEKGLYCTEETPMRPISLYGKTKTEAEKIILDRGNSISFRLATAFGSSLCMRTELLVNNFVLRALRDKSVVLFESHFKRNYIHVLDVVQAFCLGLSKFDEMQNNAFNVGLSSANLTKLELCELIKKYVDFEIILCENRKDVDQRNYLVSNEKIEKFGFSPNHTIESGIQELIKSYTVNINSYHGKAFGY